MSVGRERKRKIRRKKSEIVGPSGAQFSFFIIIISRESFLSSLYFHPSPFILIPSFLPSLVLFVGCYEFEVEGHLIEQTQEGITGTIKIRGKVGRTSGRMELKIKR
jgi:hypothetical protein